MQTLNRVGGVNDLSDLLRIGEKRSHLRPLSAPALNNCRNLFTPRLLAFFQFEGLSFGVAQLMRHLPA
jgi:hypothetical protein